MAVVSTLDPHVAYVEIRVSPGCEDIISELLASLREDEGLCFTEKHSM